jgi:hypothetical protein
LPHTPRTHWCTGVTVVPCAPCPPPWHLSHSSAVQAPLSRQFLKKCTAQLPWAQQRIFDPKWGQQQKDMNHTINLNYWNSSTVGSMTNNNCCPLPPPPWQWTRPHTYFGVGLGQSMLCPFHMISIISSWSVPWWNPPTKPQMFWRARSLDKVL